MYDTQLILVVIANQHFSDFPFASAHCFEMPFLVTFMANWILSRTFRWLPTSGTAMNMIKGWIRGRGFLNCCSAMLLCYGFYYHLFSVLTFYNRLLLLDTFTLVSYVSHWLFNARSGSNCIFTVKNFGEFSELQHFANFHYFHNIPYANGLQFTKVFSVKLSTVLVYQTFCHQSFLLYAYMVVCCHRCLP